MIFDLRATKITAIVTDGKHLLHRLLPLTTAETKRIFHLYCSQLSTTHSKGYSIE